MTRRNIVKLIAGQRAYLKLLKEAGVANLSFYEPTEVHTFVRVVNDIAKVMGRSTFRSEDRINVTVYGLTFFALC